MEEKEEEKRLGKAAQPEEESRSYGREMRESWANGEKREKRPANWNRERGNERGRETEEEDQKRVEDP